MIPRALIAGECKALGGRPGAIEADQPLFCRQGFGLSMNDWRPCGVITLDETMFFDDDVSR